MSSTWLKTCSTITILLQSTTHHPAALTAPWYLTVLQSDPHPTTAPVQIQFRLNRGWTLRQLLRFWTQQRGLGLWGLDWTLQVVGVRDRRTLPQGTLVRLRLWHWDRTSLISHCKLGYYLACMCYLRTRWWKTPDVSFLVAYLQYRGQDVA